MSGCPRIAAVKRRVTAILSIIAAVIVLAGAAWVINKKNPVADAGKTPGATIIPTPTVASPSPTPSTSSSTPTASPVTVAFIGDEYTEGAGASSASKDFVSLLAGHLPITAHAFGVTGGGYAKPSVDGNTYSDLISAAVATKPQLIVVTGGRNDEADNPDSLASAVSSFFAQLHAAAPNAMVVAFTPFFGDSPSPDTIVKLAGKVHDGVKVIGGTFISLVDPLLGHSSYMATATDPNDTGYAAIAAAMEAQLKPVIQSIQQGGSGSHSSSHSSSNSSGSNSSSSTSSG